MKLSALLLVILFGLAAAGKAVPRYDVPTTPETYAPQTVPLYVESYQPRPSKKEDIKAKISSKKDTIYTKLEGLKPKIEDTKEAIKTKLEALKAKISDKVSDIKSKFESKHTKPDHYGPRYVLVRVQPESKYKW